MGDLTPQERKLVSWFSDKQEAMLALLAAIVNIDSGSYNKKGVDAVGAHLIHFFSERGIRTEITLNDVHGDAIAAHLDAGPGGSPHVLFLGHRDTVFQDGEALRRPFHIQGGRGYGPGVADMKAGLVMNAFVLAALKECEAASSPVVALYTGDEEIASPFSRPVIERWAKSARLVLNAEPGRVNGNVVTGRKGGVFLRFSVLGRPAHSGGNFSDGISAIGEIAHKIIALHGLTDLQRGTTVNVGLIKGGTSVNTTAPSATGEIDVRYVESEDRTRVMEAIKAIIAASTVPGTTASLEIMGEFLPLTQTAASQNLFHSYRNAASDVGVHLDGEFTGACADSGFTAGVGAPTLCGVGPVGGKVHTPDEYFEVDSLIGRAQAAALTIARLSP